MRGIALVFLLGTLARAEELAKTTLVWRDFPADAPAHLLLVEPGKATKLRVGCTTAISVTLRIKPKPRLLVDGKLHPLPATIKGAQFTWKHEQLHVRTKQRWTGAVVLGKRHRPVAFLGNTLLLDLDGDLDLAGAHEAALSGAAFGWQGFGYRAVIAPGKDAPTLTIDAMKPAPPDRRPAWRPPPSPTLPRWTIWTDPEKDKLSTLKTRFRRDRKRHRREKFPSVFVQRHLHEIGMLRTSKAFSFLWSVATKDKDIRTRAHAVEAMGFPEYAKHAGKVEKLARGEADQRPSKLFGFAPTYKVHAAAAEALHYMGAKNRLRVYLDLLQSSSDDELSGACLRCIGYLGTQQAYDQLSDRLDAAVKEKRSSLVDDLYRGVRHCPRTPVLEWMVAATKTVLARDEGIEDLFALRYPQARDAALALAKEKKSFLLDEDRTRVARVLATAGDAESVQAALRKPVVSDETTLQRLLPAVRDPRAIRVMLVELDGDHRELVLGILQQIPVPAVRRELIARLRNAPVPALIRAVAHVGGEGARAAVLEAARKGGPELRIAAAMGFGGTGTMDKNVRALLETMCTASSAEERAAAWAALPEATAAMLARASKDPSWLVRRAALRAASRLGHGDWAKAQEPKRLALRADAARASGQPLPQPILTIAGIPIHSDHIVFVTDATGEATVAAAIKKLPDGTRVNVISVRQEQPAWATTVQLLDRAGRSTIRRFLKRPAVSAKQRPAFADSFAQALGDPEADTIVLIGATPWGQRASNPVFRRLARLDPTGSRTVQAIATINASELFRRLAQRSGGRYVKQQEPTIE